VSEGRTPYGASATARVLWSPLQGRR
jgi:hypothetical protein